MNTNGNENENKNITYPKYAVSVVSDMALGLICGITVNTMSNIIGEVTKIGTIGTVIVQIFLVTVVLYVVTIDASYFRFEPSAEINYDIVFVAVFLSVQKNITSFLSDIYI